MFKIQHLFWHWSLVACLHYLKLLMGFNVLSPVVSLLFLHRQECLCKGVPSLAWWEGRADVEWGGATVEELRF